MSFGVDPRNPIEYAGIRYFLMPCVNYNREPVSGVGGDYDFVLNTVWRVNGSPANSPPLSGEEGDQWILINKTGSYAQGDQNPTWQKMTSSASPALFSLSDENNDVVYPSEPSDTPPNNIQFTSPNGTISILADAANNTIELDLEGGAGDAIQEIITDEGAVYPGDPNNFVNLFGRTVTAGTHTKPVFVKQDNHAAQIDVQLAKTVTPTPSGNLFAGLSCFNENQFQVDGTSGMVSLLGSSPAAVQFNTTVSGPVVPNSSGVIAQTGATTTFTDGTVANTLRTEVQGANHALFVGRGSNTAAATITPPTNAYSILRAQGTNPSTTDPQWVNSSTEINATFLNFVGSYTSQTLRYLRLGNIVMVQINMDWSGNTGIGSTGDMVITNMPFPSGSALSHVAGTCFTSNVTLPPDTIQIYVDSDGNNDSTLRVMAMRDNNTPLAVQMNESGTLNVTQIYFSASVT